jgi:hypothetical protein
MASKSVDAGAAVTPHALYETVCALYRLWAEEMPVSNVPGEMDWLPLAATYSEGVWDKPCPPRWGGLVYFHLHALWRRGRQTLPEALHDLELTTREGQCGERLALTMHGAVYGVRVSIADVRTDWYGSCGLLLRLWEDMDFALRCSDKPTVRRLQESFGSSGKGAEAWARRGRAPRRAAGREELERALLVGAHIPGAVARATAQRLVRLERGLQRAADLIEALQSERSASADWLALTRPLRIVHELERLMGSWVARGVRVERDLTPLLLA